MIGGGAVGGGTTEVFKDVGSNVLGKVGKKLVEDGVDMALDLTQTATENGGLTGKDVLFSAVTSFGGDLVGAAKTNSTARNQLIDGATDNRAIKDAVGDSLTDNKAVKNAIADSATDNKAVKNAVKDSTSEATNVGLKNGSKLKTNDALDAAEDFLGKGYKDAGNGRFISADGTKVVRMGDNDILGKHGGGPHMNFETMAPNPAKPEKCKLLIICIFIWRINILKTEIEIIPYNSEKGIEFNWEYGFEINTSFDKEILISANKAGLISLARHLLTLAQDSVPSGTHIHFDDLNSLEDGSIGLIIEKL